MCCRKRLSGSAGGYSTADPKELWTLDLINEILQELVTPKRQIQLTAAYLKKLSGVLRDLETYVSGQFSLSGSILA